MIYLLYGSDDYRVRHAVRDIRDRLRQADDMLDTNTTTLEGRTLAPVELMGHATAVPFLAAHRLVIVEGLLQAIGEARSGRRGKKSAADDPLTPWREVADKLPDPAALPATTTLVFVEGNMAKTNAAFTLFAPIARTIEFAQLAKDELPSWIEAQARAKGVKLAPRAMAALARHVGPDLWAVDRELDKLAAYADGEVVEPETIALVVSAAQEARIWDLTDALVIGDEIKALRAMRVLLGEGDAPQRVLFMIVRQFRQLILVKDMRERRVRQDEVARAAAIPAFRLSAVGAIASRFGWPMLRQAYARILDADLSVKRGLSEDEPALQLLVHDLCAMAPATAARR